MSDSTRPTAPAMPAFTLGELADRLGAHLHGDPALPIRGVNGIEAAGPDQLTFVSNPRYARQAHTTRAGAVLVTPDFPEIPSATLRLADPYLAFARAADLFFPRPDLPPGRHPTAVIAESAHVPADAHIGPYVVVMDRVHLGSGAVVLAHAVLYPDVHAGDRLFVHAHAVIRENTDLGADVTLQPGVVLGGDGFGFARSPEGWHKIPQAGRVVLEDRVEVQSNSCIDRASVGETRVRAGSKIDNLVQVGHGSTVGEDTLLCAQVGLAGSSHVGRGVILAGQVGVAGHCTVGDGVTATAQSGIPSDVAPGLTVSGYPAVENRRWLRIVAATNRLPDVFRNLRAKP